LIFLLTASILELREFPIELLTFFVQSSMQLLLPAEQLLLQLDQFFLLLIQRTSLAIHPLDELGLLRIRRRTRRSWRISTAQILLGFVSNINQIIKIVIAL
jgi:hypothetical protein